MEIASSPVNCKCGGIPKLSITPNNHCRVKMSCTKACSDPITGASVMEVIRDWNKKQTS